MANTVAKKPARRSRRRSAQNTLILAAATALGLGYMPKAPGTFGTLFAIPLWFLLSHLSFWPSLILVVLAVLCSIVIADQAERIFGHHDEQRIVIDEVAGLLVTSVGVPFLWPEVLSAFVLFRLLDMTKPPPIGWLDRKVQGGLGVVLDDVAAGLVACLLLHLGRFFLRGF